MLKTRPRSRAEDARKKLQDACASMIKFEVAITAPDTPKGICDQFAEAWLDMKEAFNQLEKR